MKRLGAQNLAEEHPSRLVQILFYTHPPISARIDAAHVWDEGTLASSPTYSVVSYNQRACAAS
jgi:hypothetical protein